MKRLIALMLATAMSIGSATVAMAGSGDVLAVGANEQELYDQLPIDSNIEIGSLTEYDMISELQNTNYDELLELGYTEDEIEEIASIDFEKIVEKEREKGYDALKDEGYTDKEIEIIFGDDIEAAARAISAELSFSCEISRFSYSSSRDRSTVDTELSWEWDKCPLFTFTDIIGISVSNSMYIDDSNVIVRYYENGNWDYYSQTKTYEMDPVELTSYAECSFDMNLFNSPSTDEPEVALEGEAECSWILDGELTQVSMMAKYGHARISCSPDLSITDDSIEFSFMPRLNVSEAGEDYDYAER